MKQLIRLVYTPLMVLIIVASGSPWLEAQQRQNQTGEIELEKEGTGGEDLVESGLSREIKLEREEVAEDSYRVTQTSTIKYFQDFEKQLSELAAGRLNPVPPLNDLQLRHLGVVYLQCSSARGICPQVLDAIMETDVVNARLSSSAECPNMLNFWRVWQVNNFEGRLSFNVRTGHIQMRNDFRQDRLPGYIRCRDTVALEAKLDSPGNRAESNQDFFRARYGDGSLQREAVIQTIRIMVYFEKKVPNLFQALRLS